MPTDLHLWLNDMLCRVAEMLDPAYKITLVCRHPTNPNAHIVTSDDDMAKAADVLLRGHLPVVHAPQPSPPDEPQARTQP